MTELTQRFCDALAYMTEKHAGQERKTTGTPYASHPLQVAGIALEHGADEDEAVAALLHDVLEDTDAEREEIAERFGERVADIVEACSDTLVRPKPPWRERKTDYLAHLREATSSMALVSAADKLHNVRSLLTAYWTDREQVWARFRGGRDGTLWYHREVVAALRGRAPRALVDELERTVRKLHALTGEPYETR